MPLPKIAEDIFGWTGACLSIVFFIMPVIPYIKVTKGELSYSDSPGVTLVMSFLNCILWKNYGFNKNNAQVYVANFVGELITLVWLIIYFIFWMKRDFWKSCGINILFQAICVGLDFLSFKAIKADPLGWGALAFNILMYAAPGEKIIRICKTKNYKLLPIFSSCGACINAACWLIFGICKNDFKILIANGLGVGFSVFLIIVYIYYYKITGGVVPEEERPSKIEEGPIAKTYSESQ